MKVVHTPLPGVLLLELDTHPDSRGHFVETYRRSTYGQLGIGPFVQGNRSRSREGVVRGLHYQRRHPQGKLVNVARGRLMDVVVDIRVGSPAFGRVFVTELSAANGRQLWVPPGCAHGICALSDHVDLLYRCTDYYVPGDGVGIAFDDPDLAIRWPDREPLLSEADRRWPRLCEVPNAELPRWTAV